MLAGIRPETDEKKQGLGRIRKKGGGCDGKKQGLETVRHEEGRVHVQRVRAHNGTQERTSVYVG